LLSPIANCPDSETGGQQDGEIQMLSALCSGPRFSRMPDSKTLKHVDFYDGALKRHNFYMPLEPIRNLAINSGAFIFTIFISALKIALSICTSRDDITVSSVTSSRMRQDLHGLIGFLVTIHHYRTRIGSRTTFRSLLSDIQGTWKNAFLHQAAPLRGMPRILINYLPRRIDPVDTDIPDLWPKMEKTTFNNEPRGGTANSLYFGIFETKEGWDINIIYHPSNFSDRTITRLRTEWQNVIETYPDNLDCAVSSYMNLEGIKVKVSPAD
jgi:non-ribosomal peptide synthetase component F